MTDKEFRDTRRTEQRNPRTVGVDVAGPLEFVDLMYREDKDVADAVHLCRSEIASLIEIVRESLRNGGRLIYVGAGTSGRLGVLDAAECPPTFGSDPSQVLGLIAGGNQALVRSQEGAEDDREAAIRDVKAVALSTSDTVVGIAASGSTPYVAAALKEAASVGCRTAFITCSAPPPDVVEVSQVVVEISTGPELLTGSTRLKAGTATKMVLNMISTGAMVGLGKAYGNLMVDLQATSSKLVDRGQRILMEVCDVDRDVAKQAISDAGGSVKTAIVMLRCQVSADDARALLDGNGGVVRKVIGDPPGVGS